MHVSATTTGWTEMSAALGLAQIERLDEILTRREQVAGWYHAALSGIAGIRLPRANPRGRMSWFLYVIEVDERAAGITRDAVQSRLLAAGIECKPYFPLIHRQPFYQELFDIPEGDSRLPRRSPAGRLPCRSSRTCARSRSPIRRSR